MALTFGDGCAVVAATTLLGMLLLGPPPVSSWTLQGRRSRAFGTVTADETTVKVRALDSGSAIPVFGIDKA